MSGWDAAQLSTVGATEELEISSYRADGSLRPFVTIWAVAVDGALYVRSAYGAENGWYRRLLASGRGRIRSGGVEVDVVPAHADGAVQSAVDAEYLRKFSHYPQIVHGIIGPAWHAVTLRLDAA